MVSNDISNPDQSPDKTEYRFGIRGGTVSGQDLNQLLVNRAETTFYLEMSVDQSELNLFQGDIVMVDRSLEPRKGNLVILVDDEQFRAARYGKKTGIWGVVTYVIHKMSRAS